MPDDDLPTDDSSDLHQLVTWGGSLVAAVLAKRALTAAWTAMTGDDPPTNPAAPGTGWRDALLWGAAAGLVAGLARTVGRRLASGAVAST